jgi:Flp pilus assembly protein TadG
MDTKKRNSSALRLRGHSRGQSGVEFAGTALLMFTAVFGIFCASMLLYAYNFVSNSARDAVRYAIVHGSHSLNPATADDITAFVKNMASGLQANNITVSTTWTPNNDPGSLVEVQVTYDFQPFFPFSSTALPLTSTSEMVISN